MYRRLRLARRRLALHALVPGLFLAAYALGGPVAGAQPVLVVPADPSPLLVVTDVPPATELPDAAAWKVVEIDQPECTAEAQWVPSMASLVAWMVNSI